MMKGARGMKVGATRKGFYMFSRDLLSSRRYRCCSWVAKGVYLDLLNVMAVQPKPGAVCLTDFDLKPKSERSLTFRCLQCQKKAKNGEYQSIKYFAEAIAVSGASGPRPGLIHGLQELYLRGMIVIEGDMLIQPRMYQDNGYKLADDIDESDDEVVTVGSPDDGEADPDAEALRLGKEGGVKGTQKGTKNTSKNSTKMSRVDARDARAQSEGRSKSKNKDNNNDNNSIGNNGVQGDSEPDNDNGNNKTTAKPPKGKNKASKGEKNPEAGNLSSDGQKRATKPEKGKNGHSKDDSQTAIYNKRNTQGHVTIDGKPVDTSDDEDDTVPTFEDFWALYDKQVNMMEAEAYWGVLSRQDKEAIMEYVPRYKIAQPRKQFRKNPANFLRMSAWKDELIIDTRIDNNNNGRQQATTTDRRGGYAGAARTQEQDAADGREQTMRIVNRIFADQDADHQAADGTGRGTDASGDPF